MCGYLKHPNQLKFLLRSDFLLTLMFYRVAFPLSSSNTKQSSNRSSFIARKNVNFRCENSRSEIAPANQSRIDNIAKWPSSNFCHWTMYQFRYHLRNQTKLVPSEWQITNTLSHRLQSRDREFCVSVIFRGLRTAEKYFAYLEKIS